MRADAASSSHAHTAAVDAAAQALAQHTQDINQIKVVCAVCAVLLLCAVFIHMTVLSVRLFLCAHACSLTCLLTCLLSVCVCVCC